MPNPPLRTLDEQVRPGRTALVVVDAQVDYCAEDGLLAVRSGRDMAFVRAAIPHLNRLIRGARAHAVPVVWVRTANHPRYLQPNHRAVRDDGNGLLAAEGSQGAEIDREVAAPLAGEAMVTKRNYDGFHGTPLDALLRSMGVTTLVMAGFATNVCVESTARHGYFNGFYIVLASDCAAAPDPAEHAAAVRNIGSYFGKVATGEQIAAAWAAATGPA